MLDWMDLLRNAVAQQASDVFFVAGKPACEKLEGHLHQLSEERLLPQDTEKILTEIYREANRDMASFLQKGDDDFSFAIPGLARFRVNTYRQRGSMDQAILKLYRDGHISKETVLLYADKPEQLQRHFL